MSVALACDECGRWVRKTDDHAIAWIEVSRGDAYSMGGRELGDEADPLSEVRHFCSTRCTGRWFTALAALDQEAEGPDGTRALPLGRRASEPAYAPGANPAFQEQEHEPFTEHWHEPSDSVSVEVPTREANLTPLLGEEDGRMPRRRFRRRATPDVEG